MIGGNLQWPVLRAKYNRASPALFVTPQFKGRQTGVVIGSEWKRQEWSADGQDVVAKASYISICSQMVKGTSCRVATRFARAIFHQSHFDWGEPQLPQGKVARVLLRESHPNAYLKVNCLTHALPDFLEPRSWIRAVNHPPQKA
jgi:hypothetical protein